MAVVDKTKIGIASPHIFTDGRVDMAFAGQFAQQVEVLGCSRLTPIGSARLSLSGGSAG